MRQIQGNIVTVIDEYGDPCSSENYSQDIKPPPLTDIESSLRSSKNEAFWSNIAHMDYFLKQENSIEIRMSNTARSALNTYTARNNMVGLLEDHDSYGPTVMTHSTRPKQNNNVEKKRNHRKSFSFRKVLIQTACISSF